MFIVNCPHCKATLRLPDEVASRNIICLRCKKPFGVQDVAHDPKADTPFEPIDFETFEEEE
jgi:hypothetical protein